MPVAKRERSSTAPANDQKPKLPPKNPKATPASKARIDSNAKTAMAEHIIAKGIATVNPQELAEISGLTIQQVRSQLAGNRQNLRMQLMEMAKSLQ